MAFGKPLLSSHVGYITIHKPESHIQFGHVSHFFRQCVGLIDVSSRILRTEIATLSIYRYRKLDDDMATNMQSNTL